MGEESQAQSALALDPQLLALLIELVLCCDEGGSILYANPAAQRWSDIPLTKQPFSALLAPGSDTKGTAFLAAARTSSLAMPTPPWELGLFRDGNYTTASFRGYYNHSQIVVLGQVESEQVGTMQRELLALNCDLTDAQRELRRQNLALQAALAEQQLLMQTIMELSAPAVPIWPGALLLPLIGHIDSDRAERITKQLLDRVGREQARFVILDVAGIATIDTAVAHHLIDAARAVQLLGAETVLVGITPEIAQTIVSLGVQFQHIVTLSSLQHAVAYVLHRLKGLRI